MDIRLSKDEVCTVVGDGGETAITCMTGALWITFDGDNRDHLLHTGQRLIVAVKGAIVIEARRAAEMNIKGGEPASGHGWATPSLHPTRA